MILGIFLILIGVVYLLKNLGFIVLPASFWSLLYPLLLVVIGIYLVIGARKGKHYLDLFLHKAWKGKDDNLET